MESIHQFLYEWRVFLMPVTILVGLYYARVLVLGLIVAGSTSPAASTTRKPLIPRTATPKPVQQQLLDRTKADAPSSLEAGVAGRISKGHQATARIKPVDTPAPSAPARPSQAPTEMLPKSRVDDELSAAFGGLDDSMPAGDPPPAIVSESGTAMVRRKASRLGELGFHHSIESSTAPVPAPDNRVDEAAKARRLSELALDNEAIRPKSTATELEDILARLDHALGDDAAPLAAAPAMTPAAPATSVPPTTPESPASAPVAAETKAPVKPATTTVAIKPAQRAPIWARSDAFDEDVDSGKADAKPTDRPRQMDLFDQDQPPKTGG